MSSLYFQGIQYRKKGNIMDKKAVDHEVKKRTRYYKRHIVNSTLQVKYGALSVRHSVLGEALTRWRRWPPARFYWSSVSAHWEGWCPASSSCLPGASPWPPAPGTESGSLPQPTHPKHTCLFFLGFKCTWYASQCLVWLYISLTIVQQKNL